MSNDDRLTRLEQRVGVLEQLIRQLVAGGTLEPRVAPERTEAPASPAPPPPPPPIQSLNQPMLPNRHTLPRLGSTPPLTQLLGSRRRGTPSNGSASGGCSRSASCS